METAQRAVLFVDVTDSTKIYETLGDTQALALINQLFGLLDKARALHGGQVVKKLGTAWCARSRMRTPPFRRLATCNWRRWEQALSA